MSKQSNSEHPVLKAKARGRDGWDNRIAAIMAIQELAANAVQTRALPVRKAA